MTLLDMPITSVKLAIHFGTHSERGSSSCSLLLLTVTEELGLLPLFDDREPGAGTMLGNCVQFSLRKFDADVSITDNAMAENEQQKRCYILLNDVLLRTIVM